MTDMHREGFEKFVRQRGGSCMKRDGEYVESMTRLWLECWLAAMRYRDEQEKQA
jgi:hypothetical protein